MILHPSDAAGLILDGQRVVFYLPGSGPGKVEWSDAVAENLATAVDDTTFEALGSGSLYPIRTPDVMRLSSLIFELGTSNPDYVIYPTMATDDDAVKRGIRNAHAIATIWGGRVIEVDNFLTNEERTKHAVPQLYDPKPDPSLPPCIIVDLDGTLANSEHRRPYGDASKIHLDTPYDHVLKIVRAFCFAEVFFVTGRGCELGEHTATSAWLAAIGLSPQSHRRHLLTRLRGDNRPDDVVKLELYTTCIAGRYNPILVLDDRPRVIRMWNRLGLPVLAANPYLKGEF